MLVCFGVGAFRCQYVVFCASLFMFVAFTASGNYFSFLIYRQLLGLLESAKKKEQKFAGMSELPSVGVIDQDKMR